VIALALSRSPVSLVKWASHCQPAHRNISAQRLYPCAKLEQKSPMLGECDNALGTGRECQQPSWKNIERPFDLRLI